MKIYIKDYLRKIPILNKLCNMVIAYSSDYIEEDINSFNEHNSSLLIDDVTKFLDYVVPNEKELSERNKNIKDIKLLRSNQINYLTNLFYCVKGTYKVLDYILDFDLFQTSKGELNQHRDNTTKILYTTQGITINIDNIPSTLDKDLFCEYFEKFLSNLLYFEVLNININSVKLYLEDSSTTSLNHGDYYYQYYKVTK